MRSFVVLGHTQPTTPDFSLDDLAGGAGRLDVLCRCVTAAFLVSHGLRGAVELSLVIQDDVTLRFDGEALRHVAPDERNVASHLRAGLEAAGDAVGHQSVEARPGIHAARFGLEEVLDRLDGVVVWLDEEGAPVSDLAPPGDAAFVLSDHRDPTPEEAALIETAADERVSLGPEALHADQAITVAHNYLDTQGYTRY